MVYSRPIKKSKSGGRAAKLLDANDLKIFDGASELAELHAAILESRDQGVAHANWNRHSTEISASATDPAGRVSNIPRYTENMRPAQLDALLVHVAEFTRQQASEIDRAYVGTQK